MKKIIALMFLVTVFVACKKSFFDINENPNSPTDVNITPNLLAPGALTTSGNINTGATYLRTVGGVGTRTRVDQLGRWLGIWSTNTFYASGDESKYITTNASSNADWRNRYDNINDYSVMLKKANETNQTFYAGIARIMKAWNYHQLVDLYNNVPYKEAVNPEIIQPKYDNGATIYADLFNEITEGINSIKGADLTKNIGISTSDVMFKGNKAKWAKFGNTLKLRLLIHLSQLPTSAATAGTQLAIIDAEGSGYLIENETASVNPGYTAANANPFWTTYMYGTGCSAVPNNFNRANNFALNTMKSLNDERFKYFYLPVRGLPGTSNSDWKGVDYAPLVSSPATKEDQLSDVGGSRSCISGTQGLGKSPEMSSWIITSFESLFLQAEAKSRGWITTGPTAETLYKRAVTESFVWLNVKRDANLLAMPPISAISPAQYASDYLAQTDAKIAWPAGPNDQIKTIAWQRFLAFNGNNHLEIYNDYRRLGVSAVPIPLSTDPGRGSNPIPFRLLYPETEYSFNNSNATSQGSINPSTSKVFWNQ